MEHKTASPGLKGAAVGGSLGAIGGAIHGSKEKGFSMDTPRLRRRKQLTGAASGALGGAMFGALIGNHAKLLKKANKDNEMTRTKEASGLKGALIGGGLGAAYGGARGYTAERSTKKGTEADKRRKKWNTALGTVAGGVSGGLVGHALGREYASAKRYGRGGGKGYSYNSSGERRYDSDFGGGFTPTDTGDRTKVMKAHGLDPHSFKTKKEFKSKVRAAKFKTHPDRNQGSEASKKKFQDLMDAEKKFMDDESYYSKLAKLRVGDIEDDLGTYLGTKDEAKARKMIAKAKSKSFSMRHPYLTGIPTLGIAPAIANDRAKNKIVRKMLRGSKSLQKGHRKHKKRQHAEYLAERKLDIEETRANAPARAAASLGAAGLGMANAKYQYKREKMESKKKTAGLKRLGRIARSVENTKAGGGVNSIEKLRAYGRELRKTNKKTNASGSMTWARRELPASASPRDARKMVDREVRFDRADALEFKADKAKWDKLQASNRALKENTKKPYLSRVKIKKGSIAPPPAKKAIIGAFSRLKSGPGKASAKDAIRKANRAKLDRALPMRDPRPGPKTPTVKLNLPKQKFPDAASAKASIQKGKDNAQLSKWMGKNRRMDKIGGLKRTLRIAESMARKRKGGGAISKGLLLAGNRAGHKVIRRGGGAQRRAKAGIPLNSKILIDEAPLLKDVISRGRTEALARKAHKKRGLVGFRKLKK